MRRSIAFALLLFVAPLAADEKPLWAAVGPKALLAPLEPLAARRAAEGMETLLVEEAASLPRAPSYLIHVGRTPAGRASLYRWRPLQEETFAADAREECSVGRIPAESPEEVAAVVRKTIAWEERRFGAADLRVLAWAGAPGYNPLVDGMATAMLLKTVRENAPRWASNWLISGDPRQALCGWPADQPRLFCEALSGGAFLGAFVAHASADAVHSMGDVWFTAEEARRHLRGDGPTAPLLFLACHCGAFDLGGCLCAELLFLANGPVATIGATTESHPLPNYFSGLSMLRAMAEPPRRLGDLWREAQLRARKERDAILEAMLRDVEGKLEPRIDEEKLRRDQFLLYVYFGDPALRMPFPAPLRATVGGGRFRVEAASGARRLVVGWREARPADALAGSTDEAARRKAFLEANAREAYETVATIDGEGPWEGEAARKGHYRFVAEGDLLAAAVVEAR